MRTKNISYKIVLIIVILVLLGANPKRYERRKATGKNLSRPSITEEGKISLLLCCLEEDIKKQRKERFPSYFAYPFSSGRRTFASYDDLINIINTLFESSKKRENDKLFIRKKPPVDNLSATWDFQIDNVTININGEKATVKCNLIFYAAYPDTTDLEWKASGKRIKANFVLLKKENEWKISNVDKLFSFIEDVTKKQTLMINKIDRKLKSNVSEIKPKGMPVMGKAER